MILLLGGTKDSRIIAERLIDCSLKTLITTTTDYGASLLPKHPLLFKKVGKYNQADLIQLLDDYSVDLVIDATHPYAEEISKNIIEVSQSINIDLYRYERPRKKSIYAKYFDSYEQMIEILKEKNGNILLTIGSKDLSDWSKPLDINRLIIRVLPMISILKKCDALGFSPNQIIAIQGPFSKAFNKILIKDYKIKYLISKDTGAIGGLNHKISATLDSNIQCFIKKRPNLFYANKFSTLESLISKVKAFK